MGQLTSHTRQPLIDAGALHDRDGDLEWLCLLDQLYALVECNGLDEAPATGGALDWPAHWRPFLKTLATRIGAKSVQLMAQRAASSSRRHANHLLPPHRLIVQAAHGAHAVGISAVSVSVDGFTPKQEREFRACCAHLHTALSLSASLGAARESLACLHRVVDALPMCLVLLDEQLNVVLLNRQGRELLASGEQLALEGTRVSLRSAPAALEAALCEFTRDPAQEEQHLLLDGLEIHLRKLGHGAACAAHQTDETHLKPTARQQLGLLLVVHQRCDEARPRHIEATPALLARHMQSHHRFTDKELPLAWNLAQGMSLKQYAALSGRSVETARAQLKSVFRKLGVTSQKDIGLVLFEALHAVTLQLMGEPLAGVAADLAAARQLPLQALPPGQRP